MLACLLFFFGVIIIPIRGLFERLDNVKIRQQLARQIISGLEFIIAADIIRVIVIFDLNELLKLVVIVLIRAALGYTLKKEILDTR